MWFIVSHGNPFGSSSKIIGMASSDLLKSIPFLMDITNLPPLPLGYLIMQSSQYNQPSYHSLSQDAIKFSSLHCLLQRSHTTQSLGITVRVKSNSPIRFVLFSFRLICFSDSSRMLVLSVLAWFLDVVVDIAQQDVRKF